MSKLSFGRSRRHFLRLAIASAGASLPLCSEVEARGLPSARAPGAIETRSKGTQLILLGTKGGPTPSPERAAPANAILVDGRPYVVDCGNGVALQLAKAGISLPEICNIFVTHHHSDHNADLGNLVLLAWASGLTTPVHLHGPPRLDKMIDDFVSMNAIDIEVRIREEGLPPFRPLINVHEFDGPKVVLENDQVRVSATLVNHYTIKPAFAYRFDTRDRSVVFSGDTAYDENLIKFAKGADVLVHEVMYLPALERLVGSVHGHKLMDHLLHAHTTTGQVGKIAAAAGVKTLVLSHFVPGGDPAITDAMWSAEARRDFSGEVIVGKDLMVI